MDKRRNMLILMLAATLAASAQTAVDENDRRVKRIVFDGEKVTTIYADNTKRTNVKETVVKRGKGVPATIRPKDEDKTSKKRISWYTADGREMEKSPAKKGLYIERRDGRYVKKVKH